MHEYIYLKTTKLYILLLHTGVNNVQCISTSPVILMYSYYSSSYYYYCVLSTRV